MSATAIPKLSVFAQDVAHGLGVRDQKIIPSRYFYDDLGSALFEAITLLPEYGLTRADERLLQRNSDSIARMAGDVTTVCELGSGSGKKTRYLLESIRRLNGSCVYSPIDVSSAALAGCEREIGDLADVRVLCGDWMDGLKKASRTRPHGPLLVIFLGSSIGNLDRGALVAFLSQVRASLLPGDLFLVGTDLVKDIDAMIAAYDDPTGVTAAFNLNVLGRINRELAADFDLMSFVHEVRWNAEARRIEMHLLSTRNQSVYIGALDARFEFQVGETIWTESSHKFTEDDLTQLSQASGFHEVKRWVDEEWPFAESLWRVS
jgi:L-histidine Nalpha-methyltransferase